MGLVKSLARFPEHKGTGSQELSQYGKGERKKKAYPGPHLHNKSYTRCNLMLE